MKKYNTNIYRIYKEDVVSRINSLDSELEYDEFTREELITKFLPLVENIARKFSTASQASGVMDILDLIQEGSSGLIKAVDRIDWSIFNQSKYKENTMKSFLYKRIKGAIRRGVDVNRAVRIPETKLQEIRKNFGKDEKMVAMFFNSIFLSIDEYQDNEDINLEIEDKSESNNMDLLNVYLLGLLRKHLDSKEYQVLRMSYGLDCNKHSAKEIAEVLNFKQSSAYVNISKIKKQAVEKLIKNVDPSQVLDYT